MNIKKYFIFLFIFFICSCSNTINNREASVSIYNSVMNKNYQEALQITFNPDNIFKNRQNISSDFNNTDTEFTAMIEFKEKNFLQKIFDKIKNLFNKKK